MKLYVKQKIFTMKDKYNIFDEKGEPQYYVEGKFFSIGAKLTLFNHNKKELYKIQQKVMTFLPKYYVLKEDKIVATINKKFTFLKDSYVIAELGWNVSGNISDHDYKIIKDNQLIASVHKKWFSIGDSYEYEIFNLENKELILAVIIVIDQVIDAKSSTYVTTSN